MSAPINDETGEVEALQGEACEALDAPDDGHGIEYLTGVFLAAFVSRSLRRRGPWMAVEQYTVVMNFCRRVANWVDADDFGCELIACAGPGAEFRLWCELVDGAPDGVRKLWPAAIGACHRSRDWPADYPQATFGGLG